MKILFWLLFVTIFYHYFIFPFLMFIIAKICNLTVNKKEVLSSVSLIIAAYNEEKVIEEKIHNSFALEYPTELLEIIVVSDGSTDSTPDIVDRYKSKGVVGLFYSERKGKTAALNHAVEYAKGEIIIFSDANSMYKSDAIKKLIRNFNDPSIGGVCGRKSILKNESRESSKGDSLFWDFESTLKNWQSLIGSISNGDGEIFAIRRYLYNNIPEQFINDDQFITFNIVSNNLRVVYESNAISYEEASIIIKDDFKVKARMVTGGYQTISYYKHLLFPPTDYFAFQFISHKVLRYIMPFLLISLFISSLFCGGFFYKLFLITQAFLYCSALAGLMLKKIKFQYNPFYIPYYYCTMNLAAMIGLYYYARKTAGVTVWKKAAR